MSIISKITRTAPPLAVPIAIALRGKGTGLIMEEGWRARGDGVVVRDGCMEEPVIVMGGSRRTGVVEIEVVAKLE